MPLLRIQHYPGVKQVMIAGEGIADLATVELLPGERQVRMGKTGDEHLAAGVARGAVVSGALVRVITQGIISGVKTALAVQAGDRLTIATSGCVVPLNTITPLLNLISGLVGGEVSLETDGGALGWTSGLASGVTGAWFPTGRMLGRALTSGGSGLGIQMMVSPE
ncbi:hypothetical protein KKH23_09485 [Patescibacteria group bacterium]|nr:hypothetical protein [Patescibacteria group bacterium]